MKDKLTNLSSSKPAKSNSSPGTDPSDKLESPCSSEEKHMEGSLEEGIESIYRSMYSLDLIVKSLILVYTRLIIVHTYAYMFDFEVLSP